MRSNDELLTTDDVRIGSPVATVVAMTIQAWLVTLSSAPNTTRSLRRRTARVGTDSSPGMAVDLGESWIDEQIARELEMLSVEDLESDEDNKEVVQEAFQIEQPFSALPSCLEDYLHVMADQRQHVVSILGETRDEYDPASDESRVVTPIPPCSPHTELVEELVDDEEQLEVEEWIRVERETNDKERAETLAALAKLEQERVEREQWLEEEDKQTEVGGSGDNESECVCLCCRNSYVICSSKLHSSGQS